MDTSGEVKNRLGGLVHFPAVFPRVLGQLELPDLDVVAIEEDGLAVGGGRSVVEDGPVFACLLDINGEVQPLEGGGTAEDAAREVDIGLRAVQDARLSLEGISLGGVIVGDHGAALVEFRHQEPARDGPRLPLEGAALVHGRNDGEEGIGMGDIPSLVLDKDGEGVQAAPEVRHNAAACLGAHSPWSRNTPS